MLSLILRPITAALVSAGMSSLDRLFASAEFKLSLKNSIVPEKGPAPSSCTRASTAWALNDEGYYIEYPTNVARLSGARVVRNYQGVHSRNLSGWVKRGACTVSSTTITAPDGTGTASRVEGLGVPGVDDIYVSTVAYPLPSTDSIPKVSFWIKRVSTSGVLRCSNASGSSYGNWTIDLAVLPDEWVRITRTSPYVTIVTEFALNTSKRCQLLFCRSSGADLLTVDIWETQVQDVLGQTDQSVSEDVSVGVLSWPYHGLGVDGHKAFTTKKDGTPILDDNLKGYLREDQRTSSALYGSDFTNAVWVKTNVNAALNATDIRGIPNAASTLTAAANGATILQSIALSGTRAMSAFIKRGTGTGTIEFTHDGTTWTDITSSLSTGSFYRARLENKAVSNPHSIGFRFGTSGDSIIVCAAMDEGGPNVTSPIFTTSVAVTRLADSGIQFNRGSILVDNAGTAYARWGVDTSESAYRVTNNVIIVDLNGCLLYGKPGKLATQCSIYDGTYGPVNTSSLSRNNAVLRKCASRWGTVLSVIGEGSASITNSGGYNGTMGAEATFTIGYQGCSYIRDVNLWANRAVLDSQMVELVK